MTPQWLVQSNHPSYSSARDIEAILRDQGDDVHLVALEGGSPGLPEVTDLDVSRPVLCLGPSFVPRALLYPRLSPGIFFSRETFRWSAFREGWRELMLSPGGAIMTVARAFACLAGAPKFVRPDEDSKAFDGGIFDEVSLKAALGAAFEKARMDESTLVVVADAVRVDTEWRTFIVDKGVVGASSYRGEGRGDTSLHVPHRVIDLAFEAAERWAPADVFCLDIARSGERYGIVEANCFNASRFYGADMAAILRSVSEFVGGGMTS